MTHRLTSKDILALGFMTFALFVGAACQIGGGKAPGGAFTRTCFLAMIGQAVGLVVGAALVDGLAMKRVALVVVHRVDWSVDWNFMKIWASQS